MNKEKIRIKEIIVVEGRDDVTAVKRTVDAKIIQLNGFSGLTSKSIQKLKALKHAFVSRKNATKKENIGVENASDEAIKEALSHIISFDNFKKEENSIFTMTDLMENGLCSGKNSKEKRIILGDILNIGYYNSKQLLHALNSFNITKEEFQRAMSKIK